MIGRQMFSGLEQKALEIFVTSASDPIYAIRNTIPPEVFGAFGSYFSRNPKDFREHLLDAIKGQVEEQETEISTEAVLKALANNEYKDPSDAIREGLAKSQDFFRKWYGKYSHKSIANTVWIPMVATNVSQLFARELAYDQLAFFIEQSTRYVKWNMGNMFIDKDIEESRHASLYHETLRFLAGAYERFTDLATEYFMQNIPFDEWLKSQTDETRSAEQRLVRRKYEREIGGKALDVSRFLLPQAIRTNIAWILDARSTEFDVAAWKLHPLQEIRESAEAIEKHAGKIAPSLLKYTEPNPYYGAKLNGYKGMLRAGEAGAFEKGVEIISCEADSLNKVVAHILKRHNFGGTFSQRYVEAKALSFQEKIALLGKITETKGKFDEWIETDEDFDLAKITLEIRTDIGATRDWRRHQKWDRGEALYTLDNGFHTPYMVEEMSAEAKELFRETMRRAHAAEKEIRKDFSYQAQYVIPMAANHAITMSAGLDQLQYMIWTRSTPQGNFSYIKDALNIAETAAKAMPWLLGYEAYPQGKGFKEVYFNAPLKGIIRIQGWEESIHE